MRGGNEKTCRPGPGVYLVLKKELGREEGGKRGREREREKREEEKERKCVC